MLKKVYFSTLFYTFLHFPKTQKIDKKTNEKSKENYKKLQKTKIDKKEK